MHALKEKLGEDASIWTREDLRLEWGPDEHEYAPVEEWFSVEVLSAERRQDVIDGVATAIADIPGAKETIVARGVLTRPP